MPLFVFVNKNWDDTRPIKHFEQNWSSETKILFFYITSVSENSSKLTWMIIGFLG